MENEISSDFNTAIDNLFDIFSNDTTIGDNADVSRTCNRGRTSHVKGVVSNVEKREAVQIIAKVVKSDIRRFYSQMFMNAVNSGDFNQLQFYFSTFMRGPAKFVINHDHFNSKYRLPPSLAADGPKLMAHFFLGVFVMYPDTHFRMENSRITTSSKWSGTKIEIIMDVFATKVYDISKEEWIPQPEVLEEKCKRIAVQKKYKRIQESTLGTASSNGNIPHFQACSGVGDTNSYLCVPPPEESLMNAGLSYLSRTSSGSNCEARSNASFCSDRTGDAVDEDALNADNITKSSVNNSCSTGKRKLVANTTQGESSSFYSVTSNAPITEEYVTALHAQARVLPVPLEVRMKGLITLLLDENNHIQSMDMRVWPK